MNRAALEHRLTTAWQRRGLLAWMLWPLSLLHRAVVALRRALYALGVLKTERLPVPVIVIGNVIAGGAGKTPTTIAVVQYLQSIGMRPGIVSRGYGRRGNGCLEVQPDADARDTGDEPLLLRLRCQVPVFVAPRRADAARALLAAHPERDVLVCDDGLQHLALARDIEICVFDARGAGNGWLLPAGPLREPWPRAVDLVLVTETAPPLAGKEKLFTSTRSLAPSALRADGTRVPLSTLRGQPVTALAGIARPQAFFAMLRDAGLTLAHTLALPDHYDFNSHPDIFHPGNVVICTEKDAVKLWPRHPGVLAVPLVLTPEPAFFSALNSRVALAVLDRVQRCQGEARL